jgi:hypothetical protein
MTDYTPIIDQLDNIEQQITDLANAVIKLPDENTVVSWPPSIKRVSGDNIHEVFDIEESEDSFAQFIVMDRSNEIFQLVLEKQDAPFAQVESIDEIYSVVTDVLTVATRAKQPTDCSDEKIGMIHLNRAANNIARNSRRGAGNVVIGDYLIYNGEKKQDQILQIQKHNGKYQVFVHPAIQELVEPLTF